MSDEKMGRKVNRSKGFTLMELVVTLIVLAVLSAVIVPITVQAIANSRLKACAERIARDLQYARSLAVANADGNNRWYAMIFSLATNNYRVERCDSNCQSGDIVLVPVADPLEPYRNLNVTLTDTPEFQGIQLNSITKAMIFFDQQGRPCFSPFSGEGYATTVFDIVLLNNGSGGTRTISVYPITGTITIQ